MSITEQALRDLIVASVGDLNGVVAANIGAIWAKHARLAPVYPQLRALYAERDALRLLAGQVWQQVTAAAAGDFSESASDRHKALVARLANLEAEIALARKDATAATGGPVAGALATVEPVAPPAGTPDAADPRYSGSPYVPTIGRGGGGA